MYYVINKTALWDRVYEEVSRVADEAYSEDGTSLYDSVILTERDRDKVDRLLDDAVNAFVRRTYDICKKATVDSAPNLQFYVPDFDTTMASTALQEITNYLALYAATEVFKSRRAGVVPEYAERVQAAMDRAVVLLKSRKAPNEVWS